MPVIKTENLKKYYGTGELTVKAVDGVSLEIAEGEFTAIKGTSGSGKTTLLNLIGGLDNPTEGDVYIDGTDISKLTERELIDFRLHNIGFVFQAYNLIPVLTAYENTEFVMLLQNRSKEERRERVNSLLDAVGLSEKKNNRPNQLSGGQQQRVAVARALASKPKFILADEPTANLDSHTSAGLLDLMALLNREEGMTFVFSTHDPLVIDRARRVITLIDGRISDDEVVEKKDGKTVV